MAALVLDGLDEVLRAVAQEAARQAVAEQVKASEPASAWLSVKSAAKYLDTTEQAIRALVKRGEIPVHRTPNGRLLFQREGLDSWVRGESAAL